MQIELTVVQKHKGELWEMLYTVDIEEQNHEEFVKEIQEKKEFLDNNEIVKIEYVKSCYKLQMSSDDFGYIKTTEILKKSLLKKDEDEFIFVVDIDNEKYQKEFEEMKKIKQIKENQFFNALILNPMKEYIKDWRDVIGQNVFVMFKKKEIKLENVIRQELGFVKTPPEYIRSDYQKIIKENDYICMSTKEKLKVKRK